MTKEEKIELIKETISIIKDDMVILFEKGYLNLYSVRQSQLERYEGWLNELIR